MTCSEKRPELTQWQKSLREIKSSIIFSEFLSKRLKLFVIFSNTFFMQPTTRRRFIQQTSLFSAGLIFAPDGILKLNKKIGSQLYTVRDLMDKDPKGTIQKVAAIGYQE